MLSKYQIVQSYIDMSHFGAPSQEVYKIVIIVGFFQVAKNVKRYSSSHGVLRVKPCWSHDTLFWDIKEDRKKMWEKE